jgi:hypothetical protein
MSPTSNTVIGASRKGIMLEDLKPPVRLTPCKVRAVLQGLEKKDQEILIKALANPLWTHSALSRELKTKGIIISEKPITVHRAGRCSC